MLVEDQKSGGDASEQTLAEIRDITQDMLDLMEIQKAFTETIWVDSTGTFFIRKVVLDEATGNFVVTSELYDGTPYVPVPPIEPAMAGTDREITQQEYLAIANGTGFSTGDTILLIIIVNTPDGTIASQVWYNATTGATIAAPSLSDLEPSGLDRDILDALNLANSYLVGAATEATLSAINAKLGTLGQKAMAGSAPVVIASDQSTLPVSAASLPLPTDAATETTLSALNGKFGSLGQKAMAGSAPVVIASDQSTLAVSAASWPLPTGAATETTLASILADTFPNTTQLSDPEIFSEAITSGNNSAALVTVPTGGSRNLQVTSNSGLEYAIILNGSSGGTDGTVIQQLVAGETFSIPFKLAATATLRLRPTSGNMTTIDKVKVAVS